MDDSKNELPDSIADSPDPAEAFGSMTPEEQQEMLRAIQSSMLYRPAGSKHRRARELRFMHRHTTPKARKRKKDRRQTARASRQQNYRFAKSR